MGEAKDCSGFDDQCNIGVCDEQSGQCFSDPSFNGQPCDDGLICTEGELCAAGMCVGNLPDNVTGVIIPGGACVICNDTGPCPPSHNDTDICDTGCTQSFGYWKTHHKFARHSKRIPWPDNSEHNMICRKTWFKWSQYRSKNKAWRKLFHQWFSAKLNVLSGVCAPPEVEQALEEAEELLNHCNLWLRVSRPQAQQYKDLADILEQYNSGAIGPGNCIDDSCLHIPSEDDDDSEPTCNRGDDDDDDDDKKRNNLPLLTAEGIQKSSVAIRSEHPVLDFSSNFAVASTCINGDWDWLNDQCNCFRGWVGADCNSCDTQFAPEGKTFLCVPFSFSNIEELTVDAEGYILRAVDNDMVQNYLDGILPPAVNGQSLVPGTGTVDCECKSIQEKRNSKRNQVYFENHYDHYIEYLERQVEWNEYNWNMTCDYINHTIHYNDYHEEHVSDSWRTWAIVAFIIAGVLAIIVIWALFIRRTTIIETITTNNNNTSSVNSQYMSSRHVWTNNDALQNIKHSNSFNNNNNRPNQQISQRNISKKAHRSDDDQFKVI
jgi:hypothetical protein